MTDALKTICFVYELTFPNGKRYTGISANPKKRFQEHKDEARRGTLKSPVYRAWRKHGAPRMSVILKAERDYCERIEIALIAQEKGYNAAVGGDSVGMLGLKHRDSTRQLMSHVATGRKQTPEWIEARASTQRGVKRSDESRKRMSAGQKRRVRTPEELSRMSVISKQRESTPEWREKLRAAAIARWARTKKQKVNP